MKPVGSRTAKACLVVTFLLLYGGWIMSFSSLMVLVGLSCEPIQDFDPVSLAFTALVIFILTLTKYFHRWRILRNFLAPFLAIALSLSITSASYDRQIWFDSKDPCFAPTITYPSGMGFFSIGAICALIIIFSPELSIPGLLKNDPDEDDWDAAKIEHSRNPELSSVSESASKKNSLPESPQPFFSSPGNYEYAHANSNDALSVKSSSPFQASNIPIPKENASI